MKTNWKHSAWSRLEDLHRKSSLRIFIESGDLNWDLSVKIAKSNFIPKRPSANSMNYPPRYCNSIIVEMIQFVH